MYLLATPGVNEDGQLGLDRDQNNLMTPKVVEALLGVQFKGRSFLSAPLVAGSRNTLAIDADGEVRQCECMPYPTQTGCNAAFHHACMHLCAPNGPFARDNGALSAAVCGTRV